MKKEFNGFFKKLPDGFREAQPRQHSCEKKKGKSAGSTAAQNKITPSFTDERYLSGFIRTAHINKSIISAAIFFECFTLIYTRILYQKLLHENGIEVFFFFGQDEIYVVDFVFKFDCGFHAFGRA